MQTKHFVIALIILNSIFSPFARAIESNCPWNLRQLVGKAVDELEPSTQLALQDILKGVYDNPPEHGKPLNSKTSVADDLWLNDYQMWDAVKLMAELGHQRLKKEAADRKRRLMRASFFGAIGVLGGGAIVSLLLERDPFSLRPSNFLDPQGLTDDEEVGVTVSAGKTSEPVIDLLKEMAQCDPQASLASAKERIGGQFNDYEKSSALFADKVIDRLVTGGSETPQEVTAVKSTLLNLRKEFGVVICTRWGHPSQQLVTLGDLEEMYSVLKGLPQNLFKDAPVRIVLTKDDYWNRSSSYPEMEPFQLGKEGEIQYYSTNSFYRSNDQLVETLVARKLSGSPDKLKRWEEAVGPDASFVLSKLFSSFRSDASRPSLKSFAYAVANNPSEKHLQDLEFSNKQAADLLREAIAEVGFVTRPGFSGWRTPETERLQQELRRKDEERARRRRGWDR